jgi:CHAD domain-containing protein
VLEREIKLEATPHFKLPDLADASPGIVASKERTEKLDTAYFDTRDFRLTRWGCSLRFRARKGWTVKLPTDARGGMLVRGEHVFEGDAEHPPPPALTLLAAYLRETPVQVVARLRAVRRLVELRDQRGAKVAEVVLDAVAVLDGRRTISRFREVEVELADAAPEGLLDALVARLQASGAGQPDLTSKVARALGPRARRAPEIVTEDLQPDASAGQVVRLALALAVTRLLRHDSGVRLGSDPEEVHQARVAVRRLRSFLRTFLSIMDVEWAGALRQDLDHLADDLGAVRDADVLIVRLIACTKALRPPDRVRARRIVEIARAQRDEAMRHLAETISSARYIDLLKRLVDAARVPALAPIAAEPAMMALPALVASLWRNARSRVEGFGNHPSDRQLHRLRIGAKRCRYAAEALSAIVGKRARAFAKAAAGLQAVLGEQHDAVVTQAWLKRNVPPGKLSFAAGQLSALELTAAADAYGRWREAWRAFDRKKLRAWL